MPDALAWGGALLISLPFLIATYRKLKALSMLMAELVVAPAVGGSAGYMLRRAVTEAIPVLAVAAILVLIGLLSESILPSWEWLAGILGVAAVVTIVLWKWFVRLHTRLQVALIETMETPAGH